MHLGHFRRTDPSADFGCPSDSRYQSKQAAGSHPAEKCQGRGRLGRAKLAHQLRRTAETSRTTTPKKSA